MSRVALVVGINKYPFLKNTVTGNCQDLKTPASDAEAIAQLLEEYGEFEVRRLPVSNIGGKLQVDGDKTVNTPELEKAIANLFLPDSSRTSETALLFFTGHGLRKQLGNLTQGFLATSDASPRKSQWGMSLRDLRDILQQSQVQQQVIWLDCCFSGELLNFNDTELGRQSSGDSFLIAASRDYEVAYQQLDGEHGVLSNALISGLDPYQTPDNEWVNNWTLAVSVEQKLKAYCEQTKISQTPLISNHGETIKLVKGKARPNEEVVDNTSKTQLHILLHWLIQLLEDDAIESIQVDSKIIPGKKSALTPDNIVIFYKDDCSCSVETSEFENWENHNKLNLERLVPNANLALLVLERYIQSNNTDLRDTKYRITRLDVLAELAKYGLSPTPKRTEAEILATFKQASTIGRNWLRTIDGKPIPRSELSKIIKLIEQGSRSILLTDSPGSGKTCLLLDLADYIERTKESAWGLLFIKGDQFTNTEKEQDLVAKGLPEDIVGQCARLADFRRVIVIIDSLDVLSLNRQHDSLKVFLGIIDRLEKLNEVTIITACRNFDLQYDPLLRGRSWQQKVNLQPLDFDNEVKPFLTGWKVDISQINPELQALLQIPQNLQIYEKLAKCGIQLQSASAYELYNSFLEEIIVKNQTLGTEAMLALQNMAEQLMQQRTQSCSKVSFGTNEEIIRLLISQEVLLENSSGALEFTHQTLRECITVRAALAKKKQTLAQFILEHPQLPFIRPAVRAFFFYLRAYEPDIFRRQVWEVLSHNDIAYHVKRLICESFSEISPVDGDWRSLCRIFHNHPNLFQRLLWRANQGTWWNMITQHWLPEAKLAQDRETWLRQFVSWLGIWMNVYPTEVVAFWREAIAQQWVNPQNLSAIICSTLTNFEAWDTPGIQELLETLVEDFEIEEHNYLGNLLSKWVQFTNTGDTLLWRYITKNFSSEEAGSWDLASKLSCMPHEFHQENFLPDRLNQSDDLLTLVVNKIEGWGELLWSTSWRLRHNQVVMHSVDSLTFLLSSLESALKFRASQNDGWWQTHEPRLRTIELNGIRYLVIQAYKENIEANIPGIENLLQDENLFRWSQLDYELGELMNMAYPYISEAVREVNQGIILLLCSERKKYEEELSYGVYREFYDFFLWIPCIFRTPEIQVFIDTWQNSFGYSCPEPKIHTWGGHVMPPLSSQNLLKLSNKGLFQLLHHYEAYQNRDAFDRDMIGGFSEVKAVLRDACALNPRHFEILFPRFIQENLHKDYICALVEGIASHLRYRFGNLQSPQKWEPIEPLPEGKLLAATLLNWLERYFIIWENGRTVSEALEACCDVLIDSESAERLSLMLFWVYNKYSDNRQIWENNKDIAFAINSIHGVAAESAIKLCNRLLEKEQPVPEMLLLLLPHAARDTAIYVRIPILQYLPFLMYKKPDLGWQLLADIFKEPQPDLWKYTEQCFYYQYRNNFEQVAPYLNRLLHEGMEEAGGIWGRISTLSSLAGHLSQEELFQTLETTNSNDAWKGATQVFTANLDLQEHTAKCISGLTTILHHKDLSEEIIGEVDRCFEKETKRACITREFAFTFLEAVPASARNADFDGLLEWLGYESRRNPLSAMEFMEVLAEKLQTTINTSLLWRAEPLIVALNEILREADETDNPQLIQRAIKLQDCFLQLGLRGMEELLNRAGQN